MTIISENINHTNAFKRCSYSISLKIQASLPDICDLRDKNWFNKLINNISHTQKNWKSQSNNCILKQLLTRM